MKCKPKTHHNSFIFMAIFRRNTIMHSWKFDLDPMNLYFWLMHILWCEWVLCCHVWDKKVLPLSFKQPWFVLNKHDKKSRAVWHASCFLYVTHWREKYGHSLSNGCMYCIENLCLKFENIMLTISIYSIVGAARDGRQTKWMQFWQWFLQTIL